VDEASLVAAQEGDEDRDLLRCAEPSTAMALPRSQTPAGVATMRASAMPS